MTTYDSTQLASVTTITGWKVVPMAIVPMGDENLRLNLTTLGLRQFDDWRSSLCLTISYLVDPASSHMLVSKIKPCMSQYKLLHGETANGSLKQLSFIWWSFITWITMVILELIHAPRPDFVEGLCLLGTEPT